MPTWDQILKGTNGDDTIDGGAGDDYLQGRAGDDILRGHEGNDQLHGDGDDDYLVGGEGDDIIDGGTGGIDTAVYSGSVKDYTFTLQGGNAYISHTGGTQTDGTDWLLHVERLMFSDALIDLTQNNAPIAYDDSASTDEDVGTYSSGSASVLDNDFDWEGDSMSVTPGTFAGAFGTLTINADGTYTYTPDASNQALDDGESVQDSFSYTVSDGSLTDSGTLTITIAGLNDAPVANDDTNATSEDAAVSGNVLANDTDVDVETLTVANPGTYVGAYGTLVLAADGSYTYTPGAAAQALDDGESAQDVFNYTASDGTATDTAILTITVNGLNDAPVANDDTDSTTEDSSVSGNVLANDTDVDGEPLTVTNPGTYVGTRGTLVLAADGSYTYTPNAGNQALDDGESVSDVFAYTASDGTASDSATLTVTINGVNDAPVANDDSNSTNEDTAVSGNVLGNDTDVDVETLTVANAGTYVGTYGTLVLAADGSYTYTPGAGAQALDTGETAQDVFSYTASDGTASDTANLTITISGLNDPPVANDDTNTTTEDDPVSGNVLANDTDVDGETLTVANPATFIGAYGTLVLSSNGNYTYTPGAAAQLLNEGQQANDVFTYIASDGTATDSATLTITVTGLGGVPDANDDTATTNEDSPVSGNVLTNDTDDENDPLTVSNPGTYAGTYGSLTLNANGSYTYTPNANADTLAVGESAQDVFSYTATDGTGSDSATLTVTVTGLNDAPTIDAGGTDADGEVSELPDGDPNEGTATHSDSGTIAFDDLDLSDTHSASFAPQGGGYLGTFTLDPVDQMGDMVGWDFTVSDAALEDLSEGQVVTQTYTVQVSDGNGGTVNQDVVITINGAGVGTGPQTVWYIDNSAVGSTNVGTEANPYTSIAAFNAAQGMLGGPQVGHTVYILAGTGTGVYAEADGINLLDGQILTGVATGAVRPTIAATAGDGIDVAENNTISGVDVGTVSGIGIDDDGGTVGTLTITDVGVSSGGGQIVDIDHGGTLAVTLNSAASTGSTGGAIDLAGVAGSFSVSGATSIVGVHTGGGVDVTGSSAAVSLSGGGTISTGANTAVNYAGNTGSLELGGGLAIVTTSGAGLNATGGGSVTATGAGNSVTSTTGTAVTINGTNIGAAGVTLESVSSNGAVNGIVLTNTGTLGGFTVTGTGVAGSGGTIQGSTGTAILLTNTQDVSLDWMAITNAANHGILATNLRGDNSVSNSVISGFDTANTHLFDGIRIVNSSTNMGSFVVSSTTVSGGTGNDGIFMEAQGSSTMVLKVFDSTFTGLFGDGVQVNGATGGTGTVEATVQNSDFLNGAAGNSGNGISLVSLGGTMRALIDGNTFDDVMRAINNNGAINATNGGAATAHITITNNVIEDLPGGRGISFNGDGTSTSFVLIDGNSVDRLGSLSKAAINANFAGSAAGDVTITDNAVGQNGNLWTAGAGNANAVLVNAANTTSVDVLIDGNLVTANSNVEVVRVRAINGAVMNATVSDNTIQDTAGSDLEFDASAGLSTGTAVLNLNIFGNLFSETDADVIRLNDAVGGVLNVTQTDAADVSTQNDAATVSVLGTVVFAQPAPPLPLVPDLPMM